MGGKKVKRKAAPSDVVRVKDIFDMDKPKMLEAAQNDFAIIEGVIECSRLSDARKTVVTDFLDKMAKALDPKSGIAYSSLSRTPPRKLANYTKGVIYATTADGRSADTLVNLINLAEETLEGREAAETGPA